MEPVVGVEFIQSDFSLDSTVEQIRRQFPEGVDLLARYLYLLIYSDMAPNLSGDHFADYTAACNMLDCILDTYINMIANGGVFIYKIFEGPRINGTNVKC